MAFAVVHRFPNGTEEQYRASVRAVHPAGGSQLPEGQLLHLAGSSDEGWLIVAIHDSRESWERFRDETLVPSLRAGVDGGFAEPPVELTFEIRNLERNHGHTVIRRYEGAGADALFTALERREQEVRDLITSVPGFVSYTAFRTGDGGTTVTVCEDKDGTDESSRRAAAWVGENVGERVDAPSIIEGDALLQF